MTKSLSKVSLAVLLTGLLVIGLYSVAFGQAAQPLELASDVVGQPITVGPYVLWQEAHDQKTALRGYNQNSQTPFLIADTPASKSKLASDGHQLAWVQTPSDGSGASIESYNLDNGQLTTLIAAKADNEFGDLALANNILYYKAATPGHVGLYARDLTTTQEELLSLDGQNPIAGPGGVVWVSEKFQGQYQPSQWSLHLLNPARTGVPTNTIIAQADGQFEVAVGGESLVWSALLPASDTRAYRYDLSQSRAIPLSSGAVRQPAIKGNKVAWVVPPSTDPAGLPRWSIEVADTKDNSLTPVVNPGAARLSLAGLVGTDGLAYVVSRDGANGGTNALYLARLSVGGTGLSYSNPDPARGVKPRVTNPLNCGQVYKYGYQLYDCNGRWTVNGVQFILPERGINGQSFWDDNYRASVASGQVDYWLDRAVLYLQPAMLRVFVDMPGDTSPGPTSPATLYDLASRAASRGMRLGLVLHNDTSWTLYPSRKQWLSDLITYFRSRSALQLIAYLSADNEINNHCGIGPDCYDNNPGYVNGANQWTADFAGYVRSLNVGILITAGITTEKDSTDAQPTLYDFFRTTGTAPSLAATLDFLSPHNYHGGGYGIWPTLRYNLGYRNPIVLEEYGYSTDLLTQSPFFTEGPPVCRTNPFDGACLNTAPYFVEVNLRSMRENSTDGFAGGSAWMLADSNRKDCASPSDFYTGLIASGDYPRCPQNGTTTTASGILKATGARVRFSYVGTTDLTPTAPSNLTAVLTGTNGASLTWADNSPAEQAFRIERKSGPSGAWAEIATVGPNVTTYGDTNLAENTAYSYRVRASADTSFSPYSNEVGLTTSLFGPTSLVAKGVGLIQITLSWTDNSSSETGFVIERKGTNGGVWVGLGQVGPNTTSYTDLGVSPGQSYTYRLRATGANGTFSNYSNETTAATLATFDYTVNMAQDDGSRAAGSLSLALSLARPGQSILLVPPGNTLTISGPLPDVPAGITLVGNCANGPTVSLRAASTAIPGLNLKGNGTILFGLKISGFGGPQLKTTGGNNELKCVRVGS